jgi:uncharacterized protein (DUF305 family)
MQNMKHSAHQSPYRDLVVMAMLMFLVMYVLMYAMVNRFSNALPNLNQTYMAGLMTAPMVLLELVLMRAMYRNRNRNGWIVGVSLLVGVGCWMLIRQQGGIGDRQFLRSMIPHHAAAILMCEQAPIENSAIKDLCRRIQASQQGEIDEMKGLLSGGLR